VACHSSTTPTLRGSRIEWQNDAMQTPDPTVTRPARTRLDQIAKPRCPPLPLHLSEHDSCRAVGQTNHQKCAMIRSRPICAGLRAGQIAVRSWCYAQREKSATGASRRWCSNCARNETAGSGSLHWLAMRFTQTRSRPQDSARAGRWLFMGASIKPGAGSVESREKCFRGILALRIRAASNVRASAYIHSHSAKVRHSHWQPHSRLQPQCCVL
jgi:hypothetical protein